MQQMPMDPEAARQAAVASRASKLTGVFSRAVMGQASLRTMAARMSAATLAEAPPAPPRSTEVEAISVGRAARMTETSAVGANWPASSASSMSSGPSRPVSARSARSFKTPSPSPAPASTSLFGVVVDEYEGDERGRMLADAMARGPAASVMPREDVRLPAYKEVLPSAPKAAAPVVPTLAPGMASVLERAARMRATAAAMAARVRKPEPQGDNAADGGAAGSSGAGPSLPARPPGKPFM